MSLIDPTDTAQSNAIEGVVASTPAALTDLLDVTIPAFDDEQAFTGLRWMPRGTVLPTEGDACLVVFALDDEGNPGEAWVPAWWPA